MAAPTRSARSTKRISGIDAARGLAILGMLATHLYPLATHHAGPDGISAPSPTRIGLAFAGNSSTLFALLAGVSITLISRSSRATAGSARQRIMLRALVILVIGLILGELNTNIAIILVHYSLLFLIALFFIHLSTRALAWWAAGWILLVPFLNGLLARFMQLQAGGTEIYVHDWRLWVNPSFTTLLESPGIFTWDLLFSGYYPVLVFTGFLIVGMVIGRLDLSKLTTAVALAATGLGIGFLSRWAGWVWSTDPTRAERIQYVTQNNPQEYEAGLLTGSNFSGYLLQGDPAWFGLAVPHTGAPLDVWGTAGIGLGVLGICLLLSNLLRGKLGYLLLPLTGPGSIPLTIYTAHVVAVHVVGPEPTFISPTNLLITHWLVAIVVGIIFRGLGRRGPLEWIMHAVSTGFNSQPARQ